MARHGQLHQLPDEHLSRRWFVRRNFGYGWRPATWQGWLITVVAIAIVLTSVIVTHRSVAGIGIAAATLVVYMVVAWLTSGAGRAATLDDDTAAVVEDRAATIDDGSAAVVEDRAPAPSPERQERPARPAPSPERQERPRPARLRPNLVDGATRTGPPALVVEHLTKRFGSRTAVADVSFSVAKGEVFGFLGPNGAGKTTTVRTLGTLIVPTSGSATIAGIPLAPENGVAIRQRIAIMPESPGLYLRLTVAENLELFAALYGQRHAESRIREALAAVNMADRADDPCGSLSKGLRQRVGLARSLLNDPEVLFLDEPSSGLDPVAAREVNDLILELRQQGVTIFLTTHRLAEAEGLCDRIAIMNTSLRAIGSPDTLREQLFAKQLVVRTATPLAEPGRLFDANAAVESWRVDDGAYVLTVTDPDVAAPTVARALVGAGADLLSLAPSHHSLEDVYLSFVNTDVEAAS